MHWHCHRQSATDIPFPGRSGPPAQSTESNSITTAAGDLTNATLTITDDIIGDIGIENDIVMNVYSAHQTHDDENEIKNTIDTDTNHWNQTIASAGASIFSEPDPGLALAETPLFSENSNYEIYSNDPAEWTLTADLIDHFVQNPPLHGLSNNQDLSTSVKILWIQKTLRTSGLFSKENLQMENWWLETG